MTVHPLDDPSYRPKYPPVNGCIPDVVVKWGPRSQVRWFRRYLPELRSQAPATWERFYIHSESHIGPCCNSCDDEAWDGYSDYPYTADDGTVMCCCRAFKGWSERARS